MKITISQDNQLTYLLETLKIYSQKVVTFNNYNQKVVHTKLKKWSRDRN
jgi:hypothetical protein